MIFHLKNINFYLNIRAKYLPFFLHINLGGVKMNLSRFIITIIVISLSFQSLIAADFKPWSIQKYKQFTEAIKNKKIELPVADSEGSGKLFDQVVDLRNLAFMRSSKITTRKRIEVGEQIAKEAFFLMKQYVKAYNEEKRRDLQLSVVKMNLFYGEAQLAVVSTFIEHSKKHRTKDKVAHNKLVNQIKDHLHHVGVKLIKECDRDNYTDECRLLMAKMLYKNIRKFSYFYTPEEKSLLKSQLAALSEKSLNTEVQEYFTKTVLKIK
ncbi:hypothetical protein LNTAR_24606 [Lentisphaera araneosa HTCC2155]|uniref:Uncharacterized protein n=1 Tax=Lentisphaera araneosa HTCC2155 TaxID=313628 RepID=A6DT92_9BACT|nr:hypothetical protein [Lentisphaera araneosa]EDM25165.1 hypothetical protein LNTAR_24606 [Lentisphaera araneosa HTCC2155]